MVSIEFKVWSSTGISFKDEVTEARATHCKPGKDDAICGRLACGEAYFNGGLWSGVWQGCVIVALVSAILCKQILSRGISSCLQPKLDALSSYYWLILYW